MDLILLVCLFTVAAVCLFALLRHAAEIPDGYEDERGFHFGPEPFWSSDEEF